MADIPAIMADIPATMADIPALMADLGARRWADLLSQIPQSSIQNPGEYGDSGPSSSTQRDFLRSRWRDPGQNDPGTGGEKTTPTPTNLTNLENLMVTWPPKFELIN